MGIINTRNVSSTTLKAGGVIPIGNTVHKCGCNMSASANAINITGRGYYKITAIATIDPDAVAPMTITMLDNGTAITSATNTPAVADDAINLALEAVIYNRCGCNEDAISFVLNSAGVVTELDVIVEEL